MAQSPHTVTAHGGTTQTVIFGHPDQRAAALLSLKKKILFQFLKALSQIACNSSSSLASQRTFNDTQGCGVPKLIQVRRIFFIIMLLFKLSTEKVRGKREDFFSGSFRSLEKKNHLKDKKFKRFYTESTRKQSEMRNSSEGEETCVRCRAQQSLPPTPHSHSFSFGRTGCIYTAQRTSGDFTVGLRSAAYSDPSSRNRTKSPKKSKCSAFQTYHSYLKINNNICWFSNKETGRGKQRYQTVCIKVLLLSLSSHMLYAITGHASCGREGVTAPALQSLKYLAYQPSPHLLVLLFPFLLHKFKLASSGNGCREKPNPRSIQAKPRGFTSTHVSAAQEGTGKWQTHKTRLARRGRWGGVVKEHQEKL